MKKYYYIVDNKIECGPLIRLHKKYSWAGDTFVDKNKRWVSKSRIFKTASEALAAWVDRDNHMETMEEILYRSSNQPRI